MKPAKTVSVSNRSDINLIVEFISRYRMKTVGIVIASVLTGVFDSIGIVTLVPLLGLVAPESGAGLDGGNNAISAAFSSVFEWFEVEPTLYAILSVIFVTVLLKAIGRTTTMTYIGMVRADIAARLRQRMITSLMNARWEFFVRQSVGHFANSIGIEANKGAGVYQYSAALIAIVLQIAVYMTVSIFISWEFTVGILLLGVLMYFLFNPLVRLTRRASNEQADRYQTVTKLLVDGLSGLKPLKAMGSEKKLEPLLIQGINEIKHYQVVQVLSKNLLGSFQEPLISLVLCIGFAILWGSGIHGFAELIVLLLLFYRAGGQIGGIQASLQVLQSSLAFYRSFIEKVEKADANRELIKNDIQLGFQNSIELSGVSYSYDDKKVIDNVSLSLPYGSINVIHGVSGGGKTTLVDLLCGLYLPQQGSILIDGEELTLSSLKSWRPMVGYVGQEIFLFHASLRDNLLLGSKADDALLEQALITAGAQELLMTLPEGLDTIVGERGSMLSGGQRQRIALARALVRKPKLLILDEVTASLDPKTEQTILQNLSRLRGEMTIFVVSHQPAIQGIADQVISLADGSLTVISKENTT